jgi:hypothetical protein
MSIALSNYAAEVAAFPKGRLSQNEITIAHHLEISSTPGEWRPDALTLDRDLLDRIVDGGEITEQEQADISDWTAWAIDIPKAMEWSKELAWTALEDLSERHCDEAEIERRLGEIAALEGGVFSALVKARIEQFKDIVPGFEGKDSGPSSRELAKHYRLYRRYVDTLLMEVYPDLSREVLLNPWPEWGCKTA